MNRYYWILLGILFSILPYGLLESKGAQRPSSSFNPRFRPPTSFDNKKNVSRLAAEPEEEVYEVAPAKPAPKKIPEPPEAIKIPDRPAPAVPPTPGAPAPIEKADIEAPKTPAAPTEKPTPSVAAPKETPREAPGEVPTRRPAQAAPGEPPGEEEEQPGTEETIPPKQGVTEEDEGEDQQEAQEQKAQEAPEEAKTEDEESSEAENPEGQEEAEQPAEAPEGGEHVDAEKAEVKEPEEPEVKITHRKKRKKPIISLADEPKTPEEEQIVKAAIGTTITPTVDRAPALDGQKFSRVKEIKKEKVLLGGYVEPWRGLDPDEIVQLSFEDSELKDLLAFLENNLNITFILDDDVGPERAPGSKPLSGTRITFTSHVPMTLKQVWELGVTFLEMAGYSITPTTLPRTYHVTEAASDTGPSANTAPLPTYIGSDPELLPDSDIKVRYVYFVQNFDLSEMVAAIDALRSGSSGKVIQFPQLRAAIITDKASYIKSYMKILHEIDTVTMADSLAIIRLKHGDARQIQKLYLKLIGTEDKQYGPWHMRNRKPPTTHYFTKETRVFAEPRTNSLVVFGTRDNIKKFEDFVIKHFDKKLDLPFSPLHIHQLHHINAEKMAEILGKVIQGFYDAADEGTKEAIAKGGVRDGHQFIRQNVKIVAEPSGNRLIINADYEEYLKIREILDKLDVEQPQVALKVLILDINLTNVRQLGTQIRNKRDCLDGNNASSSILGDNINAQAAMLGPLVTREGTESDPTSGADRLLGDLIDLAALPSSGTGLFPVGSTLVSLGRDIFGVWGLLRILEQFNRLSVVANPFLVAQNNYKAEISVGETRRVLTALVQGTTSQESFGNLQANLEVIIEPRISYDDMVTMQIFVRVADFIEGGEFPTILQKEISTEAIVGNRETVALGGFIRDRTIEVENRVPILGYIPFLGWFFKNKDKTIERTTLLILITPEILKPEDPDAAQTFTYYKVNDAKETLYAMDHLTERRDPIHRWFFEDHKTKEISKIDKFIAGQSRYADATFEEATGEFIPERFGTPAVRQEPKPKNKKKKNGLLDMVRPKNNRLPSQETLDELNGEAWGA